MRINGKTEMQWIRTLGADYNKDIPLEVQAEEWEAEHNPPPRPPVTDAPTWAQIERRLDAFAEMIGKAVGEILKEDVHTKIAALEKRIAELEAGGLEFTGPYEIGRSYRKGQSVNHGGSLWIATRDYPDKHPGLPNSGFKLAVKKGRDAR